MRCNDSSQPGFRVQRSDSGKRLPAAGPHRPVNAVITEVPFGVGPRTYVFDFRTNHSLRGLNAPCSLKLADGQSAEVVYSADLN